MRLAASETEQRVKAQVVRALADVADPVLSTHRLDAGRAEDDFCRRVADLWNEGDARVRLEVLVALGRLRWSGAPQWLRLHGTIMDPALFHAAMQLLRRAENWPAVLELLDVRPQGKAKSELRTIALRALADQSQETIVDGLLTRLKQEPDPQRRREYFDLLSRAYKRPAEWTYWGFRPAPRPANSVEWERTESIVTALGQALSDPDFGVRTVIVRRMLREGIPVRLEQLTRWLMDDQSADGIAAILFALEARPAAEIRPVLEEVVMSSSFQDENRLAAFTLLIRELDDAGMTRLRRLADMLDEGPVLATAIGELARRPDESLPKLLTARLASQHDDVRAACAAALAQQPVPEIASQVVGLLADRDVRVRRAGAVLAGKLQVRAAVKPLLEAVEALDRPLRGASLESLLQLDDPEAVSAAVKSLDDAETQVAAIAYLGRFGSAAHLPAVKKVVRQSRSIDVLRSAALAMLNWGERKGISDTDQTAIDRALAEMHGFSGLPVVWRTHGSVEDSHTSDVLVREVAKPPENGADPLRSPKWQRSIVTPDGVVRWEKPLRSEPGLWLAATDILLDRATDIELLVTAKETFRPSVNDVVLIRDQSTKDDAQTILFSTSLDPGRSRLVLEFVSESAPEFQLHFRGKSSKADHERLMKLVLETGGNAQRGRELFLNAEKTQCVKCHRLGEQGGRIGPDLAGIGSRFSRIHLVESVLEPSRTIAPSYETLVAALVSGQVLSGVKSSETATELVLGDTQGKLHTLLKSEIDELQPQSKSTMPEGSEQRLSDREFLDLIEFLTTQKKSQQN